MRKKVILLVVCALSLLLAASAFSSDRLHKAAYKGKIDQVKELLAKHPDPDERDSFGGTALHAAMFQKNTEVVRLLIGYGLDVNAQGTSNGYTPLHDAVWADNLDAVKILLDNGARTEIKSKEGITAYEKAVQDGRTDIVRYMDSVKAKGAGYDTKARNTYSPNDVKAFVYQWFAGFDHQEDISVFTRHLDPARVDMAFPDFPIRSVADFQRWYDGVVQTIQWNSHDISNLIVRGDEENGFQVGFDIRWQARTYDGKTYDVPIHQEWRVEVGPERVFVLTRHRASVIDAGK